MSSSLSFSLFASNRVIKYSSLFSDLVQLVDIDQVMQQDDIWMVLPG